MSSRAILVGLFAVSACFDDVPVFEVAIPAFVDVTPALPFERSHEGLATFRWEILESPEGSFVSGAASVEPRPKFQFNRRGSYVLDRWIESGLSERLTHHVVFTVSGAAPVARISGTTYVAVRAAAALDARTSSSPENRSLTYRWRLSTRPPTSQRELSHDAIDDDVLSFVPDVEGDYGLELSAFDGELWSEPAAVTVRGHD